MYLPACKERDINIGHRVGGKARRGYKKRQENKREKFKFACLKLILDFL